MEKKNKKNIFILIIRVLVIFLMFELITQVIGAFISSNLRNALLYGKYSRYLIGEAGVLIIALLWLMIKKKWDIFRNQRIKFNESIKLGLPLLILTFFMVGVNSSSLFADDFKLVNLVSLIIYTALIGFFEEIFFRGIIESELLNNYSDTKKHAVISILISAFIFGIVHITNVFYGQDILTTGTQVVQTIAIGVLFGSIYYVSKNIWAVIFLHGFYDFSILLGDVNLIKDCGYVANIPISVTIQSVVVSLFLSCIYILYSIIVLKNSNVFPMIGKEVTDEVKTSDFFKEKLIIKIIWIVVLGMFGFNIAYNILVDIPEEEYYVCYNFEKIKISRIESHYYSYNDFNIVDDKINLNVYMEDSKALIKDNNSDKVIDLGFEDVNRVVVIDNNIMIITTDLIEYKIYYYNGNDYLNLTKDKFLEFDVSDVAMVGYLIDVDNNIKYPMVKSNINDCFVIDGENLKVVTN